MKTKAEIQQRIDELDREKRQLEIEMRRIPYGNTLAAKLIDTPGDRLIEVVESCSSEPIVKAIQAAADKQRGKLSDVELYIGIDPAVLEDLRDIDRMRESYLRPIVIVTDSSDDVILYVTTADRAIS